jgi:hypothetical protein
VTAIKRFRFLHHFILPPTPHQTDRASLTPATSGILGTAPCTVLSAIYEEGRFPSFADHRDTAESATVYAQMV